MIIIVRELINIKTFTYSNTRNVRCNLNDNFWRNEKTIKFKRAYRKTKTEPCQTEADLRKEKYSVALIPHGNKYAK